MKEINMSEQDLIDLNNIIYHNWIKTEWFPTDEHFVEYMLDGYTYTKEEIYYVLNNFKFPKEKSK